MARNIYTVGVNSVIQAIGSSVEGFIFATAGLVTIATPLRTFVRTGIASKFFDDAMPLAPGDIATITTAGGASGSIVIASSGSTIETITGLVTTVADLPPASPLMRGLQASVTDSNATLTAGIGAVVAGGGANCVPVFCDGTNWRIT